MTGSACCSFILSFYFTGRVRRIEMALSSWRDDSSLIANARLFNKTFEKKQGRDIHVFKFEQVLWCPDFNNNRCSVHSASHQNNVQGQSRLMHHICRTCWRNNKKQLQHPQNSSACPYKNWLPTVASVEKIFNLRKTTFQENSARNENSKSSSDFNSLQPQFNLLKSSKKSNNQSDYDYIQMHDEIVRSGRYNFEGCKFPLKTNLKIDYFRFLLHGYEDECIFTFLEFGFPLGYFGEGQHWSPDSYAVVRNHGEAKNYPLQIQKILLKEKSYQAILGPFTNNPYGCNIALSPLNSVAKKHSQERRIILYLNFPNGHSINYFVSKDLRRFYRQIGIDTGDSSLVGFSFSRYIYFDKVLSMGLKSTASIAKGDTTAIKCICRILGISIEIYLDDLAGADCPEKAWKSY